MAWEDKSERQKEFWWKQEEGTVYETLFEIVGFFQQNQSWREQMNLRNLRLYGDFKNMGMAANTYALSDRQYNSQRNRITFNIIKSICDTIVNRIGKNRPKVTFLTEGGNQTQQTKAKLLDKFIEGLFYKLNSYEISQKRLLDGAVFGSGATKIYRVGKQIKNERVFINELKVDEAEAINGDPRQLFQIKSVSRELMISLYPEHREKILDAQDINEEHVGYKNLADQVTVIEAWHLPTTEDSNDGRHVISMSTVDLVDETWTKDHFPFVFSHYDSRLLGFWGYGVAEALTGIQFEINNLLQTIQLAMRLCSVPKVFVETGSRVVPAHLNNEVGGIIFYSGTKPSYEALQAVSPELFNQLDRLVQRAYELTGVSQLSAQSKKPSGLNSGVALREFNDIESERLMKLQQDYERSFLVHAEYIIELAKEIYEEYGEFDVTVEDNRVLKTIKWSEIDLPKESMRLKMFPTSALPTTPAGKLEKVVELVQSGFLPKEVAFNLLEFPDIESAMKRLTADYDDIQLVIEKIVEDGNFQAPEPYQNLQLGIAEMQRAYLRAKLNNVSPTRLELMRRWINQAESILNEAAQAQAQPVNNNNIQSPNQTIAEPQQPPVSDLIPLPTTQPPAI